MDIADDPAPNGFGCFAGTAAAFLVVGMLLVLLFGASTVARVANVLGEVTGWYGRSEAVSTDPEATDDEEGTATAAAVDVARLVSGRQYALLIGVRDYRNVSPLSTPLADVGAVKDVLTEEFGFVTEIPGPTGGSENLVLENPSRDQIVDSLETLVLQTAPDDHVLIYFAGHSEIPDGLDEAYWLPVDADAVRTTNWISASDIRAAITRMAARSVLVVSDSCYSSELSVVRGLEAVQAATGGARTQFLSSMTEGRNRLLIASGTNEPVADLGKGQNSVFSAAFIGSLRSTPGDAFTASELFVPIREAVVGQSTQEPTYRIWRDSGHESGDFVFVRHSQSR